MFVCCCVFVLVCDRDVFFFSKCPWMLCVSYCVMVCGVLCVVVLVCLFMLFVWFVSESLCDVVWCVFFL